MNTGVSSYALHVRRRTWTYAQLYKQLALSCSRLLPNGPTACVRVQQNLTSQRQRPLATEKGRPKTHP